MKKIFITLFLLSFSLLALDFSDSKTQIKGSVDKVSGGYKFSISAPTTGWVSIGFEPSSIMKDAEIIMLWSKDNKAFVEHHFGDSRFSHVSISSLDKTYKDENLKIISSSIVNDKSIYEFLRTETTKNKYIKNLTSGKKIKLILAYGSSEEINKKHKKASSIEITLP